MNNNENNLAKVIQALAPFNVPETRLAWLAGYILEEVCCGDVALAVIHAAQPGKSADGKYCW